MSEAHAIQPKVFCSYSWTNQEYQNRIIFIAERLMEAGIDVLLDKWDLVEGADTHAYMEKAISDKSVTHVLIFSDSGYAQKADSRVGGVGKETLIITPDEFFAKAQIKDKCIELLKFLGCNNIEELKRLFIEDEVVINYSPTGWIGLEYFNIENV